MLKKKNQTKKLNTYFPNSKHFSASNRSTFYRNSSKEEKNASLALLPWQEPQQKEAPYMAFLFIHYYKIQHI